MKRIIANQQNDDTADNKRRDYRNQRRKYFTKNFHFYKTQPRKTRRFRKYVLLRGSIIWKDAT